MEPKPICLLTRDSYEVSQTFTYRTQHNTHTHIRLTALFCGTTRVSQYQKGKTNLDFTEARDSEWQWHQLGHMQVCISLQTDNHTSTPLLSFFTGQMPFLPPNQQRQSMHANRDNFDSISFLFCHYPSLRHVPQKRMICIFIAIFQVHIS